MVTLQQFGTTILMYVPDHDERLPMMVHDRLDARGRPFACRQPGGRKRRWYPQ
jgi:hypothetical protein